MFAKIGRDYVHINDLKDWIEKLRIALGPVGIVLPPLSNDQAISRGLHYKELVENGEDGTKHYSDIVEFDDESDEDEGFEVEEE
tara:strand:- start:1699 stop:1950 length:252 start_codon:yes stop_codon:yes gene_type:complete